MTCIEMARDTLAVAVFNGRDGGCGERVVPDPRGEL